MQSNIISPSDYFDDIVNQELWKILSFQPQLYFVNNLERENKLPPYPLASSVLLSVNGKKFLVTAGHALYSIDLATVGVMINDDFCPIEKHVNFIESNTDELYEPNNLDIAIVELSDKFISEVQRKYSFLDLSRVTKYSNVSLNPALIVGHPEIWTRRHYPSKSIIPRPFVFRTTEFMPEFYSKNHIDPNVVLALMGDRANIMSQNRVSFLPELEGVSGGGVWSLVGDLHKTQFNLTAIFTGEDTDLGALYSSRLFKILHNLKQS